MLIGCQWPAISKLIRAAVRSPESRTRATGFFGFAVCLMLVLVPTLGCRPTDPESSLPDPLTSHEEQGDAKLQRGLDFLNRLDEFDQAAAQAEVLKNLQDWFSTQELDTDWKADPFSERLPAEYRPMVAPDRLTQTQLELYDVIVLQEATWMRDVARSIQRSNEPPPDLATLLSQVDEDVSAEHAAELGRAIQLFDWTARNLQLDEDVQSGKAGRFGSDVILHPWESLLFGRGTASEKSRVFILLCRQMDIPAVMLAIAPTDEEGGELKPWLPAVLLGDQLYLFDMRIGVPAPGPGGRGVASLAAVHKAPELLEPLALPEEAYRVTADELARVVALVDATPPELSQRMQHLENALVGQQKLVLTTSPSQIAVALDNTDGIQDVHIWTMPYDGFIVRNRLQQDQQGLARLAFEHSLFDGQTPLARARILHLRGQYDNRDDRPGASELYLECRVPERQIKAVADIPMTSGEGQSNVAPTAEQKALHRLRLASVQAIMSRTKENATYWLGLMNHDQGQYGIAIDYLERLLQISPDTQWKPGAVYNLGRAYEARGRASDQTADLERARELYASQTLTPTAAACQWRARQLAAELAPEAPARTH